VKTRSKLAVGALVGGLAISTSGAGTSSAHLDNWTWSNAGHSLQNGSRSNMVGFWQVLGYTQKRCPGGYYDGIFGSNTVAQTKEMQLALPTPGTTIPITGVVNGTTWNAIQGAWVYAFGTSGNAQRLGPVSGVPYGGVGNYTYYGGSSLSSALLAWGNDGGPIWKFQVYGTSSWFNATSSRTMGSTSAC